MWNFWAKVLFEYPLLQSLSLYDRCLDIFSTFYKQCDDNFSIVSRQVEILFEGLQFHPKFLHAYCEWVALCTYPINFKFSGKMRWMAFLCSLLFLKYQSTENWQKNIIDLCISGRREFNTENLLAHFICLFINGDILAIIVLKYSRFVENSG